MSKFVNLAMDMGTSGWKVGCKNNQFYLTSLVTKGPIREQINGVFAAEYSEDSIDNIAINTDEGLFYVGNVAKFSQTPVWSGSAEERYLEPKFMEPMTHAAMSEAKASGPIVITTAIPAKWEGVTAYHDGEEVLITDAVNKHFFKDHTIVREGYKGQKTISVDEVKILTETQALLYSFLLKKDGKIAVENFDSMRYAVVDIGELTTCIDVFRGLSREGSGITLTDVSMGKVHKETASQVLAQTGRDLAHWEIRDIVQTGRQIMVPARGKQSAKEFKVTSIYNENVNQLKPVLKSHFGDYITRADDIHYIIVGGGGSETIGQTLKASYRQAKIAGQFATLQGLRNYGERLCQIKNR